MRRLLFFVLLLPLCVPAVMAHGPVEAKEVETLILTDFADDSVYELGGYDLYQVFAGEAYFADLGDGFYFHTILFGDFAGRPAGQQEFRVIVTVATQAASVSRAFWTTDGDTFETDFDLLEVVPGPDEVEVQRAFISLGSSGFQAGDTLTSVKVQSLVDGDLRDASPGGRFVPGTDGQVEIPEDNPPATPYLLTGPVKYVNVTAVPTDSGIRLEIQSLLKEGGQHVHVIFPLNSTAWTAEARMIGGPDLPKASKKVVELTLTPRPDPAGLVEPLFFNVTTDIGGRIGLVAAIVGPGIAVLPDGTPVTAGKWNSPAPAESPLPSALAVMAVGVAVASLVKRRK